MPHKAAYLISLKNDTIADRGIKLLLLMTHFFELSSAIRKVLTDNIFNMMQMNTYLVLKKCFIISWYNTF